jgi:hypothetical protein
MLTLMQGEIFTTPPQSPTPPVPRMISYLHTIPPPKSFNFTLMRISLTGVFLQPSSMGRGTLASLKGSEPNFSGKITADGVWGSTLKVSRPRSSRLGKRQISWNSSCTPPGLAPKKPGNLLQPLYIWDCCRKTEEPLRELETD